MKRPPGSVTVGSVAVGSGKQPSCIAPTRPLALRFADWPERDRTLWERNTKPAAPFEDRGPGAHYAAASLKKFINGYATWLAFLARHGRLDTELEPGDRVTPNRLRRFFQELQAAGNRDYTIIGRFAELAGSLAILAPERKWRWVCKPGGISVHARLPKHKRPLVIPHPKILYDWGGDLMASAVFPPQCVDDALQHCDGLAIAMNGARGRRVRSMALLEVGTELIRDGAAYRLCLPPSRVKTRQSDRMRYPTDLTGPIDLYLAEIRSFLMRRGHHTAFWVGRSGQPLSQKSFAAMHAARTKARFGIGFGPHRARHAISSAAPIEDPTNPGLAAGLLGISRGVDEAHYNRAGQAHAAQAMDKLITGLQAKTRAEHGRRVSAGPGTPSKPSTAARPRPMSNDEDT